MSTQSNILPQSIDRGSVYSKHVAGAGNGLFAARDLPVKSQILAVSRPLMVALETSRLQDTCYQCLRSNEATRGSVAGIGQEAVDLKVCTGCRVLKFCDKECQTLAWTQYHKWECKPFSKLYPRVLPAPVRAVFRLLKQHKAGALSKEEWDQLLNLESHQDELSEAGGQRWQNMFLMVKAVKTYSGTEQSIDIVLKICCILMVNSFTLTTPTFDPIGIVMHPLVALTNHSCAPNAIVRFDINSHTASAAQLQPSQYGSISIQALNPISTDTEITISYIDATFPFSIRQTQLKDRYFFTCTCPLCLHREDTILDHFLPPSTNPSENPASSAVLARAESIFLDVQSKPLVSAAQIPNLRLALHTLAASGRWPLHRYPYAQLRQQLVLALLSTGQDFDEALMHAGILVRRVDPVLMERDAHHPVRVVHAWTFWGLCRYVAGGIVMGREEGRREEASMLGLIGCAVLDGLVKTLKRDDGVEGGLERMVKSAMRDVLEEGWVWKEYERSGEEGRARWWGWLEERIERVLGDEFAGITGK